MGRNLRQLLAEVAAGFDLQITGSREETPGEVRQLLARAASDRPITSLVLHSVSDCVGLVEIVERELADLPEQPEVAMVTLRHALLRVAAIRLCRDVIAGGQRRAAAGVGVRLYALVRAQFKKTQAFARELAELRFEPDIFALDALPEALLHLDFGSNPAMFAASARTVTDPIVAGLLLHLLDRMPDRDAVAKQAEKELLTFKRRRDYSTQTEQLAYLAEQTRQGRQILAIHERVVALQERGLALQEHGTTAGSASLIEDVPAERWHDLVVAEAADAHIVIGKALSADHLE